MTSRCVAPELTFVKSSWIRGFLSVWHPIPCVRFRCDIALETCFTLKHQEQHQGATKLLNYIIIYWEDIGGQGCLCIQNLWQGEHGYTAPPPPASLSPLPTHTHTPPLLLENSNEQFAKFDITCQNSLETILIPSSQNGSSGISWISSGFG